MKNRLRRGAWQGNSGTGSGVYAQTTLGTPKPVPELQAPDFRGWLQKLGELWGRRGAIRGQAAVSTRKQRLGR